MEIWANRICVYTTVGVIFLWLPPTRIKIESLINSRRGCFVSRNDIVLIGMGNLPMVAFSVLIARTIKKQKLLHKVQKNQLYFVGWVANSSYGICNLKKCTFPNLSPAIIVALSGATAQQWMGLSPVKVAIISSVPKSQTLRVLFHEPEIALVPSGVTATAFTE